MADVKESALTQQSDCKWVRALDANGNSIRISKEDLASVVGGLLGIDTNVQVGSGNSISVMNYFKRIRVLTLNKTDAGNKVFTIVLAEINENYDSKYYSFELYATPKNGANTLPGYAHVEFITNSQSNKFSYISCGSIDNIRLVNIDSKEKLVADINVPQYGGSDVFLTGLHNYINVIEDVSNLIG